MLKQGGFRLGVDREYEKVFPMADGLVATDGVQWSAVASFGTLAVDVFSKTIDPGYTIDLQKLQIGLTYRLQAQTPASVGSFYAHWTITPEYGFPTGGQVLKKKGTTINISGTYQHNVPSYAVASYPEFSLIGNVPVASIGYAPFSITLTCRAILTGGGIAQVKNSSYVKLIGCVIPGT